jgi:hypothetical protein
MSRLQHVLETHQQAGRPFEAAGVRSFVREQGTGPAVLCLHGMIGSSFLYRKVLAELTARGRACTRCPAGTSRRKTRPLPSPRRSPNWRSATRRAGPAREAPPEAAKRFGTRHQLLQVDYAGAGH